MTSAEDYKNLADQVYGVDPELQDPPVHVGQTFPPDARLPQYTVYDTLTDPRSGIQAMAVVPVVDGQADYSKVIVSYAGTNPDERADTLADLQSVIGGRSGPGTQVFAAQAFAVQVRDRLKREGHPDVPMETVGHSLGGYLALLVAAENRLAATTFNGPDPWDALSPEAQEWVKEQTDLGRNPFTNYVNEYDLVGNVYGNRTGSAVFVRDARGKGMLEYHNLSSFEFEEDGSVKGVTAEGQNMEAILQNVANSFLPGSGPTLGPILKNLASGLQTPRVAAAAGQAFSGLVVAVDTVSALALATSIAGTETHLAAIKRINGAIISEMQAALTIAKQAAYVHPFITEADIETCVSAHRLHVHHNIDVSAVAAVDSLLDDQIDTVRKIADGVVRTVANAAAQDAQWALVYSGH